MAAALAIAVMFGEADCRVAFASGSADDAIVATAMEELFAWLGLVRINAVGVTSLREDNGDVSTAKVALALYPLLASCANHDCQPNSILRFGEDYGVEVVVSAVDGLSSEAEVTISYGPTAELLPRARRREILWAQYGFECLCIACTSRAAEDFTWRGQAEAFDARAHIEASRRAWDAAAVASAASLACLRRGYAEGSLELAREECKLAGLLLQCGQLARSRGLWAAALPVLRALVSPSDPDLGEAEEMLRRLPGPGGLGLHASDPGAAETPATDAMPGFGGVPLNTDSLSSMD